MSYVEEDYSNIRILGIGKSAKGDLKAEFKKRYGSGIKWQEHWAVYKDLGGNKNKLSKTWAEIDKAYESSPYKNKTKMGKILSTASKVTFKVPVRAMFLLFVNKNVFNLATIYKLAQLRNPKGYKQLTDNWKNKMGGKIANLEKNIEKGYKRRPMFAKPLKIDWNQKSSFSNAEGSGYFKIPNAIISTLPVIGATVGTIINPTPDPVTKIAGGAPTGGYVGTAAATVFTIVNAIKIPMGKGESGGMDEISDKDVNTPTGKDLDDMNDDAEETEGMESWQWLIIGVCAAVLVTGGIYLATRNKNK